MEKKNYIKHSNGKTNFSVCCKKCMNLLVTTHRKPLEYFNLLKCYHYEIN